MKNAKAPQNQGGSLTCRVDLSAKPGGVVPLTA